MALVLNISIESIPGNVSINSVRYFSLFSPLFLSGSRYRNYLITFYSMFFPVGNIPRLEILECHQGRDVI